MSKKQLEDFFAKAKVDKHLKKEINACDLNNICIAAVGNQYGHKFSPATVGHWQREHRNLLE